ncbi:MAG: 1-deoxy-D-xylulose-5-phosphate reductoisomerase [Clostridia bacterium]|nr:1-deoxy-D-xylulose-5-phosphate reductoisomerase [Clostridia bacterium]
MKIKKVAVLGSTGSVGTQTMDVVRDMGLSVSLLSAWSNLDLLTEQICAVHPDTVFVRNKESADVLKERLGCEMPRCIWESDDLLEAVRTTDADCIVHAIAGLAGIPTALAAAESGKRLAMANKEAVIVLGDKLWETLRISGGEMIPVDSEHSAIFQCLNASPEAMIKRILLTASGGPFFGYTAQQLACVTKEQTLAHPTWKMGPKITVDSATLMNKGFEIMEAVRLFHVPEEQVEVLIHRQSIIHSMVEYTDNTVIAQLAKPDMRYCIRYALTHPERDVLSEAGLNFTALARLTFDAPDTRVFPLLNCAREAIRADGTAPCGLIAADEAAVEAFFGGQIGFADIAPVVRETMEHLPDGSVNAMEEIMDMVAQTKAVTGEIIRNKHSR